MVYQSIPWRDNGLLIAAFGASLFAGLITLEYLFQEVHYQEPVLQVDLLAASETDSEEGGNDALLLSDDQAQTARQILTAMMTRDDESTRWQQLQQQFPAVDEGVWLQVASSADSRRYRHSAGVIVDGLLANTPESLPVLFQHAKLAASSGNDELATERYAQLLAHHPYHQASLFNMALLLAREDQHQQAIATASRAIEASSGELKAKALSVRASSYVALDDYSQAVVDFRASIQFRPTHASTWRKLANALLYANAAEAEILQAFNQAVSLQTDYLQALHERARFHWLRGDLASARQDLEKTKAVAPDYQPARWTLLHLYLAMEKRRSAREEIRWLRTLELSARETEFLSGLNTWSKRDYPDAANVFTKLANSNHQWAQIYAVLSAVRGKQTVSTELMASLEDKADTAWMYAHAGLALAEVLQAQGQGDRAIAVLQNLRDRHPQSHFYAYSLGRAFLDQDYYLEAASALQRAVVLDEGDSQTQLSLGVAYTRAEQYELALLTCERLLARFNNHRSGRYNYALLLDRLQRQDEAIEQLQQLLSIDTGNTNAQYRLAHLLAQRQQFQPAIDLLQETLAERPTYHRARERLAEVHYQRGALESALEEVNRLLVLQGRRVSAALLKSDILRDQQRLAEAADVLLGLPAESLSRTAEIKLFNIGKRALDAGQLTLAERCYQTLVIWDPDYDKAFVNLSAALNRQEKFAATLAVLEPRTDLLAKNHKLAINLAEAHHALGNNQQVITLLEPLQAERLLSEEAQLVLADSNRKFVRGSDLSHE